GQDFEPIWTRPKIDVARDSIRSLFMPLSIEPNKAVAEDGAFGGDEGVGGVFELHDAATASSERYRAALVMLRRPRSLRLSYFLLIGADLLNQNSCGLVKRDRYGIDNDDALDRWEPQPAIFGFPARGLVFAAVGFHILYAVASPERKAAKHAGPAIGDGIEMGTFNSVNAMKAAEPQITETILEHAIDAVFEQTMLPGKGEALAVVETNQT